MIEKRLLKEESGIKESRNRKNSKLSLVEIELENNSNDLSDSEVSENSDSEGRDETG